MEVIFPILFFCLVLAWGILIVHVITTTPKATNTQTATSTKSKIQNPTPYPRVQQNSPKPQMGYGDPDHTKNFYHDLMILQASGFVPISRFQIGKYKYAIISTSDVETAYKTLELRADANVEDLKKAYRELAKKYHPDKNPTGTEKFKAINSAYLKLKPSKGNKHLNANLIVCAYDSAFQKWFLVYGGTYDLPQLSSHSTTTLATLVGHYLLFRYI